MNTSGKFSPKTILLWQKVADHPEAQRILSLFPSAKVYTIKQQRYGPRPDMSAGQALLAGKKTLMIGQASCFVGYFNGQLGPNVCCRPYYKLVPISNGCPFYCTYCYLAFIYRKYAPFIKVNINYDTMFKQIRKTIVRSGGIITFNMGEMPDSLALDNISNLTTMLVPFFSNLSTAYLMLLTKSNNINNLLALKPNRQAIISWSLNSQQAIKIYEPGTASLDERIAATRACQDHGYRIRLRIDPGILHANWQAEYADLVQKTLTIIEPENITLGLLRLLPGHLQLAESAYGRRARNLHRQNFEKGASDGKLRYSLPERLKFYAFLIDIIRSLNTDVSIGLCRETPEIWDTFKNHCNPEKCNCLIW